MSAPKRRKRNRFSLEDKLGALRRLDAGESIRRIAESMGAGEVTVGDWRRNRAALERWCAEMASGGRGPGDRSTMKGARFRRLDEALFAWFARQRERGVAPDGPAVRARAIVLNGRMGGDESFTASSGWLYRWKKRHGVRRSRTCEEGPSADSDGDEDDVEGESSTASSGRQLENCGYVCIKEEFCELDGDGENLAAEGESGRLDGWETTNGVLRLRNRDRKQSEDCEGFVCVEEEFCERDGDKDDLTGESLMPSGGRLDGRETSHWLRRVQNCDEKRSAVCEGFVSVKEEFRERDGNEDRLASSSGRLDRWETGRQLQNYDEKQSADCEQEDNNNREDDPDHLGRDPISHVNGAAAFEAALHYAEQQSEVTPADILVLKRWRAIAVSKCTATIKHEETR